MGRGRQKAKHTKIARELKSYSPEVDYSQLERELTGHTREEDPYARWADYETEDETDETPEYEARDQKRA